jgi:hypothetical protein
MSKKWTLEDKRELYSLKYNNFRTISNYYEEYAVKCNRPERSDRALKEALKLLGLIDRYGIEKIAESEWFVDRVQIVGLHNENRKAYNFCKELADSPNEDTIIPIPTVSIKIKSKYLEHLQQLSTTFSEQLTESESRQKELIIKIGLIEELIERETK